jgi:predicted RNA methylase
MAKVRPRDATAGRFVDVSTAALRPEAAVELAAYGITSAVLRGADVLDIGTGDGRLAFGAAAVGAASVTGVDPDPAALRAARRHARSVGARTVSFRLRMAQELELPSARFDVAILSWAL